MRCIAAFVVFTLTMPALAGCFGTFIGVDHPKLLKSIDFGPPQTVRLCIYLDSGVSEKTAQYLLSSWQHQAAEFKLVLQVAQYRHLARRHFFHSGIMEQVLAQPLDPDCDRVLYFVNRNFGDIVWGDVLPLAVPVPEVLGEVDDRTFTHGFVVATRVSVNQVAMSPFEITRHELYHLMGCRRHFDMPNCYQSISALKLREQTLAAQGYYQRIGEAPFYPTWDGAGNATLDSRAAVRSLIRNTTVTQLSAQSGS